MKLFLKQRLQVRILSGACLTVCLLGASQSLAQLNSPVSTWDFVISGGGQQGIAILTFSDDFTFSGHEMMASTSKKSSDDFNRDNSGRTPVETNSLGGGTNLFGYSQISGQWFYDASGKIVGNYFVEVGSGESVKVQGVSFSGKVVPGKRFTMVASTANGKLTYKGIPFQEVSDLTAYWTGTKTDGKQTFIELFALSPTGANVYNMDGTGPAYSYSGGVCMVSAQKKIGFTLLETPEGTTNAILRATVGSFVNKPSKTQAKTKGIRESSDNGIKFDAALTTLVP